MKVFLSWSGDRSHALAKALREWLPAVLQPINPWLSSTDINAGARWQNEVELQLQESRAGIICLTPENLSTPWLLYETGALSKVMGNSCICPYLLGFTPSDLTFPFAQFQATTATRSDTYKLLQMLNHLLGKDSIDEGTLHRVFDKWWPDLEHILSGIGASKPSKIKPAQGLEQTIASTSAGSSPPKNVQRLLTQVLKQLATPATQTEISQALTSPKERVFIVHGHNQMVKEMVSRFIEKLGLAAIILHEQPNEGRTIIEKFESHATADYAVVLLTGDDAGGPKNTSKKKAFQQRARQNVVFELGFFTAKLGRSRISVLYEEGVEMPSDYSGILYIPVDAHGAWRFQLASELKTAGLRVDLNRVI